MQGWGRVCVGLLLRLWHILRTTVYGPILKDTAVCPPIFVTQIGVNLVTTYRAKVLEYHIPLQKRHIQTI